MNISFRGATPCCAFLKRLNLCQDDDDDDDDGTDSIARELLSRRGYADVACQRSLSLSLSLTLSDR